MKTFFLFFTIFVVIQWFFKRKQQKYLFSNYYSFLQSGDVLLERNKGVFTGSIIMFKLDNEANIKDCLLLNGATFFAKWKKCDKLIHKNVLLIEQEDIKDYKKNIKKVILKAINSYKEKR